MSRIGKNPISYSSDIQCRMKENIFFGKGKLGELSVPISSDIDVTIESEKIIVSPKNQNKTTRMMWGTTQKLIHNLIHGISVGFTKHLEITGVGYRASVQGTNLVLQLGYSHDVIFPIPQDIKIICDKPTSLSISGINRQRVGQTAAEIRSYRPPEPYKGKGVRYRDEVIVRKEGKKK